MEPPGLYINNRRPDCRRRIRSGSITKTKSAGERLEPCFYLHTGYGSLSAHALNFRFKRLARLLRLLMSFGTITKG